MSPEGRSWNKIRAGLDCWNFCEAVTLKTWFSSEEESGFADWGSGWRLRALLQVLRLTLELSDVVWFSTSWVWRPCWVWRWHWSRWGRSLLQCWSVPSLCSRTSAGCGPEQSPRNPATWDQTEKITFKYTKSEATETTDTNGNLKMSLKPLTGGTNL